MRVITYNIRGGLGMDGHRSTSRIASVILPLAPDVVCFQEVHRRLPWSRFVDQPRRLQKQLGLPFVFQPNLNFGFGGYGLGIVSRFEILSVRRHFLPSRGERRGALEARLQTPRGALTVFCTHWGLDSREREQQAAALANWVNDAPAPLVVCGDFNDRPAAASVQILLTQTQLRDAGADSDCPTYPAGAPEARIDYVLHSSELRREGFAVIESQASDHWPLVVDFA